MVFIYILMYTYNFASCNLETEGKVDILCLWDLFGIDDEHFIIMFTLLQTVNKLDLLIAFVKDCRCIKRSWQNWRSYNIEKNNNY